MKLYIIVALVVILVALVVFFAEKQKGDSKKQSYFLRDALFSKGELALLTVLENALPSGLRIYGKVRLEDFLGVKSGLKPAERTSARNKINRKHVDFLIVEKATSKPVLAIELDDKSHEADDRKLRDNFVDEAYASAGLPILHIPAKRTYEAVSLRKEIDAKLQPSGK